MKFEKQPWKISPEALRLEWSPLEREYLEALAKGASVQSLVNDYISKGWLVSFSTLWEISRRIQRKDMFEDALLAEALDKITAHYKEMKEPPKAKEPVTQSGKKYPLRRRDIKVKLSQTPFFRNLPDAILELFVSHAVEEDVPPNTKICSVGALSRDLYVVVSGELGVYKEIRTLGRVRVAVAKENALVGEVGFLLGQPRTADVISMKESTVLRISYIPEVFDNIINKEIAQSLGPRFWALQAIVGSPILKVLPEDTVDALILAGKVNEYDMGFPIFTEGEPAHSFFILIQGTVVVSQKGHNIRVMQPGQCFGEVALFSGHGVATASVRTQLPCLAIKIEYNDFLKLLSKNLLLAREIEKVAHERLAEDKKRAG